jgi:transposase
MADSPKVRVREPRREGQEVVFRISEDSLPPEHPARLLWEVLGRLDLSAFMAEVKSVQGAAGGPVRSRRMLLTLWLYAFVRGIVHAREIERRLSENDIGFRWIAGDLHVSHTLLSEFLTAHHEALVTLFTDVLGVLKTEELIFLPEHRVAQDGTRVHANAGSGSFRTRATLEDAREQAELHLKAILARMDDPPLRETQQQARERGAMDVLDRVKRAAKAVEQLREERLESRRKSRHTKPPSTEPKASTTDPEARIMKMSQGGFAPGYNVQLAVMGSPLGGPIAIVGLQLTSLGTDKGSILPMCAQVEQRTEHRVDTILVDADHLTHEELREAQTQGRTVIAPVPEHWLNTKEKQDPAIERWTAQMQTEPMRYEYRTRKSLVERANAILKERFNLRQVPVRGLNKVLCVFLMAAVAVNLIQHATSLLL